MTVPDILNVSPWFSKHHDSVQKPAQLAHAVSEQFALLQVVLQTSALHLLRIVIKVLNDIQIFFSYVTIQAWFGHTCKK